MTMRLLSSLSASFLLLSATGSALAAQPRSFVEVGSFSPASVKPLVISQDTDQETLEMASLLILSDRAPWIAQQQLTLGPSRQSSLSDGRRIVKHPQLHKGLVVMHRGASVSFGEDGIAHVVTTRLAEDLPSDVTPSIAMEDAAKTASKVAGVEMDAKSGRLVIWPSANGSLLAYHFYMPAFSTLPYAPGVVIDAKTGETIVHYNAAVSLHQASVYPSNPIKSPQLQTVQLPLPANATLLQNELIKASNCIDKKTTKNVQGFNVHTCELIQTVIAEPGTLDFTAKPSTDTDPEDPFAELHIFTHTQRAYDYFRVFDPGFKVQAAPLDAVANLRLPQGLDTFDIQKMGDPNLPLAPFQNAFFSPGGAGDPFSLIFGINGAAMMFGQGPMRDYSYDADVIYHEFTHAVVNATIALVATPNHDAFGISMSPGSMNEGLADYFSSAMTGDPDVGEYASKDFDPSASAIRSLANPDICPTAVAGEVHQDATLFSGALWDVRKTLTDAKKNSFDMAVFAAMQAAPSGDLRYDELATLIGAQVQTSASLGSAVKMQLDEAFTKRGVLPECSRIIESTGSKMQGPMPVGTGGGGSLGVWLAPNVQAANISPNPLKYAPGVVQYKVTFPANTDSITVEFQGATSQGGFGGGGSFTPRVLVRPGADPIQFTYSPFAATSDLLTLTPEGTGSSLVNFSAKTDIPIGATSAFIMIANAGSADGLYTNVAFSFTQTAGGGTGGNGGGGTGGAGEGGSGTGANTAGPTVNEDGSCGCSVPGASTIPAGASLAALAGAIGLLARRRRK